MGVRRIVNDPAAGQTGVIVVVDIRIQIQDSANYLETVFTVDPTQVIALGGIGKIILRRQRHLPPADSFC